MRNVVPGHQKPLIFALIFHLIFMFFPDLIPEAILGGSERPPLLKSAIFEHSTDFIGPKSRSRKSRFPPKSRKKVTRPSYRERPGADLDRPGAIWHRFGSKDVFFSILGWFLVDFGMVFGMIFGWIFNEFS